MTAPQFLRWQQYYRQQQSAGQPTGAGNKRQTSDPEEMQRIIERAFGG